VEDLILYTTSSMRALYQEYSKMITSVESTQSRTSYCTSAVNKLMGMAVSYLIVDDKQFLNTTKPKVEMMLDNIRLAFNTLVKNTTWMDYKTQLKTSEKSESMKSLIGFPEWILNKTELENYYKGVSKSPGNSRKINLIQFIYS
jgi:predicted metalloendopeptidase